MRYLGKPPLIIYWRKTKQPEACSTFLGRSRGHPDFSGQPRTVIGVPRRQCTGRCCPRDAVAEIEDGTEEVLEGENGDGAEPDLENESADTRYFRCVPRSSIFRFIFMTAPKFSAER